MDEHNNTLASLSRRVAHFHTTQTRFRIYHGSTNSTRPSVRTHSATLDTSSLNHVISVDPEALTCLVEPNVPMDALVAVTLAHGLVPPVVPEFPGITVGGGFAGTAGESSSFKYGFFDRAVNWFECILGDGEVVIASEDERQDLFRGSAGTFGTLGVVTLFEIRLLRAKSFVELEYISVTDILEAQKVMERAGQDQTTDFLDAIMYAPDSGVVMVGKMVDDGRETQRETKTGGDGGNTAPTKPPQSLPVVTFSKAWDQWFYLHAEERMHSSATTPSPPSSCTTKDLIPLIDYLFRYDRGAFWTGKYAYWYFCTPFNRLTRWALDMFMHTRTMYHALHRSGLMQRFIIQDMAVPNDKMPEFSRWLDQELYADTNGDEVASNSSSPPSPIYPRWLCPLRQNESVSMHPHTTTTTSSSTDKAPLLNIGVWGPCPPGSDHTAINRRIEAKLQQLQGMKWLYAQAFYTEAEFWAIYDREWYDGLRRKYKAESTLPNVYEKVVTTTTTMKADAASPSSADDISRGIWSVWPLTGLYGVLSTIKGGDYLRK